MLQLLQKFRWYHVMLFYLARYYSHFSFIHMGHCCECPLYAKAQLTCHFNPKISLGAPLGAPVLPNTCIILGSIAWESVGPVGL